MKYLQFIFFFIANIEFLSSFTIGTKLINGDFASKQDTFKINEKRELSIPDGWTCTTESTITIDNDYITYFSCTITIDQYPQVVHIHSTGTMPVRKYPGNGCQTHSTGRQWYVYGNCGCCAEVAEEFTIPTLEDPWNGNLPLPLQWTMEKQVITFLTNCNEHTTEAQCVQERCQTNRFSHVATDYISKYCMWNDGDGKCECRQLECGEAVKNEDNRKAQKVKCSHARGCGFWPDFAFGETGCCWTNHGGNGWHCDCGDGVDGANNYLCEGQR